MGSSGLGHFQQVQGGHFQVLEAQEGHFGVFPQFQYCEPGYEMIINETIHLPTKSFCSCTHVNSCQNYILYINLHILLNNLLCKTTSDIQESRKFIKFLRR